MAQLQQYVTPKGKAFYPNLRTPNVFEGNDLGYDCRLILSAEETEKMEDFLHRELAKAASLPEFVDKKLDEGDYFIGMGETEDGDTYFKFKTKSTYKTKSGEVKDRVVPIFDSAGKPLPKELDIGHGSIVKVAYSVHPFYKTRKIKGLTLYLNAVQVIELVKRGERDAGSYGFGAEEGGYVNDEVGEDEIPFAPENVDEGADF